MVSIMDQECAKPGSAGADVPKAVFSSVIGRPRHEGVRQGKESIWLNQVGTIGKNMAFTVNSAWHWKSTQFY